MRRAVLFMLLVLTATAMVLSLTGRFAHRANEAAGESGWDLHTGDGPEAPRPVWQDVEADQVREPGAERLGPRDPAPSRPRSFQAPSGDPPHVHTPTGQHPPGLVQQRDLRRRIAEAIGLGRRARAGDQAAKDAVAAQLAGEADPRLREALVLGEPPAGLGQNRGWAPPVLPEPAARAEPGEVRAYWVTPDSRGGTYESAVTVDASGRAQVETVYEADNGERWHVRYPAWAFRDAQGRLVVDARGQPVECLQKPEWGWWSPDSMVIGTDGLIDMIDDKHDPGQGTSGANGPG